MDDDLEARLESHAQAFEGLLSLIPAKEYYGQDNSDQWQRKKQTKEQKRAAKRAKLDPANQKTAKDVMDENERKRKRELGMESDNEDDDDLISGQREMPGEGLRKNKKTKTSKGDDEAADAERVAQGKAKAEKRKEKRERKKEKIEKKKEKVEAKKVRKQDGDLSEAVNGVKGVDAVAEEESAEDAAAQPDELDQMDMSGLADEVAEESSVPTTPEVDSPAFDISANHSTASSSSSIVPPATEPAIEKPTSSTVTAAAESTEPAQAKKGKAFTLPKINSEELQSRLKARIEELRARRKATGPEGRPVRSRQEMLEARRQKEEARKLHKKELRRKAKEEEDRINNDRLRGSGSPLVTDPFSPSHDSNNNFSFGRVVFDDGAQADASLKGYFDVHKKGPQDTRTALQVAQKKAERLAGMEDSKRADIEEKDLWLNAKKRAHGEKVRDDQNLLKKALKRKEHGKLKSEKEWNGRKEDVAKGIATRERKRDENLKKRAEGKGQKGKKAKGGVKGKGKPKGRPGFEGRFKS
ncbi:hypothetical protein MBLNU457_7285t1 [Dothideomycetes sp. NU457]